MSKFLKYVQFAAIAVGAGWPLPGYPQLSTVSEGQTIAQSPAEIAEKLSRGRLSDPLSNIGKENPSTDILQSVFPVDQNEGLPKPGGAPDPRDVLENAYSSVRLIERALKLRLDFEIGERIGFMEDESRKIIRSSRGRTEEMLMRVVLNRGLDTLNLILPIYGKNTEEVARALSSFQRDSFVLAASYANQKVGLVTNLDLGAPYDSAEYLVKLEVAEFGARYARLLWKYASGLSSGSSKAVLLMHLTNYLGWDINTDLRRRERGHAEILADVYEIQQSKPYAECLRAISSGLEPHSSDVARLRLAVFRLIETLPERLKLSRPIEQ